MTKFDGIGLIACEGVKDIVLKRIKLGKHLLNLRRFNIKFGKKL